MSTSPIASAVTQPITTLGIDELIEQCLASWREVGLTRRPRVRWFPRIAIPHSTSFDRLFERAEGDDIDAVMFADERRNSPLHNLRDVIGALQLPIIDVKGRAGDFADVHFDIMEPRTWVETARCILRFRQGRKILAPQYRETIEAEQQLLAHTFVSGRSITGMRYPLAPTAVCYPGFFSAEKTIPIAESLVKRGYLRKSFFDRVHECGSCSSRRLSVREECPSCRSADLQETALIHHFHCAALLAERDFRQDTALICPKCSRQLRNYGKDYDRPGHVHRCNNCAALTSEPEVGFICLDCNAKIDADSAKRIDLFSYSITDAGADFLQTSDVPMIGGLPISLAQRLDQLRSDANMSLAVAEITYHAKSSIIALKGEPTFNRLRALFLENVQNHLAGTGSVHVSASADYLLIDYRESGSEADITALLLSCENILSDHLEASLRFISYPASASQ